MKDLRIDRLPFPKDAPKAGSCVRVERSEPGLVTLFLDPPHRSLAVLDAPLLRDLEAAVTMIENDASVHGVVITGRDPKQFAAGADVRAIADLTDPVEVEMMVRAVHELFLRISRLKAFTVAAVGGAVPGGAYELSLACNRIVASDDPGTRIGLPETQLGILPGWGGSHRLPERVGIPTALAAILTGKLYVPRQAKKLGLVDRLAKPEYLLRIAVDIAMRRERCARPWRGVKRVLVDRNPAARALIKWQAKRQALLKTRGEYPAIPMAIDLVVAAPGCGAQAMIEREAKAVGQLATGSVCKSLIAIFFGMEEAKKLGRKVGDATPRRLSRGGVVGAGIMGGSIASLMAEKGMSVRLMDLSAEALDEAELVHRAAIDKKRRRRRLERHAADGAIDRFEVTTKTVGFDRVELVVEAVAEKMTVKRAVLGRLAEQAGDQAILATNTSSLSVDAIAAKLPHPERVCGMHFFNPVRAMPLVEVVRGKHTSDEVVATVAALALRMGKTPIVVKDVAGFLVNRLLGPYLDEAVRLFVGGADVQRIDGLMVKFGMPMGPFTLLDEVGFDIARHAAASLLEAYGERMTPSDGLEKMSSDKRLGKKTGLGFYQHPRAARGTKSKPVVAEDLSKFQTGSWARELSDEDLVDRLVLSMLNEGARCLEEQVVATPAEFDLATVFGTGFAPFRGGLLRYGDMRGLATVRDRLQAFADALDVRGRTGGTAKFAPARVLVELAAADGKLHDWQSPSNKLEPVTAS